MVIRLTAQDGELCVHSAEDEWSRVVAKVTSGEYTLGSDSFGVIVRRLRAGLSATPEVRSTMMFDGVATAWLLSLSEEHGSIYTAQLSDGTRALYFQDASGNLLGSIHLAANDVDRWIKSLDELLPNSAGVRDAH